MTFPKRRRLSLAQPTTAKLVKHGRRQAVCLPRDFRLEGKEVRISRVGDKLLLEPIKSTPIDPDALWAKLDAMGARDFLVDQTID